MPERHSTNLAYRSYIETHIRPKWADWRLRKLTSMGASFTVEQWLKSLDLAPKTKGNIRNVMAVIFNCAMRWGLIDLGINPVSLVRVKGISRRQNGASHFESRRDSGVNRQADGTLSDFGDFRS
jgi:integrase